MFYQIVDQNIRLELIESAHTDELFQLTDQNRTYLKEWLPWVDHVHEKEDTFNFIKKAQERWIKGNGITVLIRFNQKIVGCIELRIDSEIDNRASIGYWLDEGSQGKGIITTCCKHILDYGFQKLELHRIEVRAASANKKSLAIPKRLGINEEGHLKQAFFRNDNYEDMTIFGITASVWESRSKTKK